MAGSSRLEDINATFAQPFVSYTTPDAWTFTLQTESTYDWKGEQWSVPINAVVQQLFKIGPQRVQFGVGGRYWPETPDGGPEWGVRAQLVLLFPR